MRSNYQALAMFYAFAKQELGINCPEISLRNITINSNLQNAFLLSPSLSELAGAVPEDSSWKKRIQTAKYITFFVPFSEQENKVTYKIS